MARDLGQILLYSSVRSRQFMRYWKNILLLSLGTPAVYISALGFGLGGHIHRTIEGLPYPTYVASGSLVGTIAVIFGGYGLWPITSGFDGDKHFIIACNAPMSPAQVALGEMLAIGVRVSIQAASFWLVGICCGLWQGGWSAVVVPISVLTGMAIYAPLGCWATLVRGAASHFAPVYRLLAAFYLLGGSFSPVDSLPTWARWFSLCSPVTYGLRLSRGALRGEVDDVVTCLAPLLAVTIFGSIGMCFAFRSRIEG